MNPTAKKPWPSDAVVIVAETRARVRLDLIQGEPIPCSCLECGAALTGDTHTRDRAMALQSRTGRPVKYLCVHCATQVYDMGTVTQWYDDRNREGARN